jgi:hypothetical protein
MVRQALAAADGHMYIHTATAPHELTKGQQRFVNERHSITTVDPFSSRREPSRSLSPRRSSTGEPDPGKIGKRIATVAPSRAPTSNISSTSTSYSTSRNMPTLTTFS